LDAGNIQNGLQTFGTCDVTTLQRNIMLTVAKTLKTSNHIYNVYICIYTYAYTHAYIGQNKLHYSHKLNNLAL